MTPELSEWLREEPGRVATVSFGGDQWHVTLWGLPTERNRSGTKADATGSHEDQATAEALALEVADWKVMG